jgi:hypothetical protein
MAEVEAANETVLTPLPCPFCGSDATASDEFNEDGYWSTYCKSCKGMTAWFANKTASIIAWNRRVNSYDANEKKIAALVEEGRAARWLASVVWLHYHNATFELDPLQKKHLELAIKAGAPFSEEARAVLAEEE